MIVEPNDFNAWSEKVSHLYRQAALVLKGLDDLGLYQAGGHLSLAMDAMLQAQRIRTSSA